MRPFTGSVRNPSAATALAYDSGSPRLMAAIGELTARLPVADRVDQFATPAALIIVSIAFFYAAISRSAADHFWMDEVLAVSAAGQASWAGVWNAIWAGTDFSPPTYHFLLHGLVKVFGAADGRLIWRLPSIVAVYGVAVCTYLLLIRSQRSRFAAALAFAIVLAFGLFDFAIQVRQYALLALGLAVALLLWTGMDDDRVGKGRACGLWLVLAACLCLHFYGIVEAAVIGTAELIYTISRRRVRIAVWMVLLLTLPVEAALYPLAAHLSVFNHGDSLAPEYYAKPTLDALFGAVDQVINGSTFGDPFVLAALLAMAAAYLWERSAPEPQAADWRNERSVFGLSRFDILMLALAACLGKLLLLAASLAILCGYLLERPASTTRAAVQRGESAAIGLSRLDIIMTALAVLPLLTFAFSALVTKSFSARYMSAAALLPAIAIAVMVDQLAWRRVISVILMAAVAGILVMRSHAPDRIGTALSVLQKTDPSVPAVIGEGLLYIELMQAADPDTRRRLVFLKTPAGVAIPDPTNENEVIRLATFHPEYQVSERQPFLARNSAFYVLSRPGVSVDTTTPALAAQGLLAAPIDCGDDILLLPSLPMARVETSGDRP